MATRRNSSSRTMAIIAGCLLICIILLKLAHTDDEGLTYFSDETLTEETAVPEPADIAQSTEPTWYKATIQKGDTISSILTRYHVDGKDLKDILAIPEIKKYLRALTAGKVLEFSIDSDYRLQELTYQANATTAVLVTHSDTGLVAEIERKPIETRLIRANGKIQNTLSLAVKKAQLPEKMTVELAKIFSLQIDFAKDIRPGDRFKVVYEKDFVGNKEIRVGNLLAAEFTNKGRTYRAIRYVSPDGRVAYYTPEGKGLQKAFTRHPVRYSRISSSFNPGRLHPILQIRRPHWGVDFAAPSGTPVKASANGKINFSGRKGGYGNAIVIDHSHQVTTLYAHLKKIATGITPGKSVKQGQVIGYVGSTGLASGPHLHYEFKINGVAHNPLTVKLPASSSVPKVYLARFKRESKRLTAELDYSERA